MRLVRHPHGRQFAGVQKLGELDCVAAIRLHPVAGALGYKRRRDHGRSSLVAEVQLPMPLLEPRHHPMHRDRIAVDLPEISDLARSPLLRNRHRMTGLCHVQADENSHCLA